MEVNALTKEESWMTPYLKFLLNGTLPEDKKKGTLIKAQAYDYCIIQGRLHRKGEEGPDRQCLFGVEAIIVLKELHKGTCGSHS